MNQPIRVGFSLYHIFSLQSYGVSLHYANFNISFFTKLTKQIYNGKKFITVNDSATPVTRPVLHVSRTACYKCYIGGVTNVAHGAPLRCCTRRYMKDTRHCTSTFMSCTGKHSTMFVDFSSFKLQKQRHFCTFASRKFLVYAGLYFQP